MNKSFIVKMIFKIIYNNALLQLRSTFRALETCASRFWKFRLKTTGMHVNISGAGVIAHANALKLIEFLSRPEAQQLLVNNNFAYPVNPQTPVHPILATWGPCKQDDINVAAAGELQAAAIKLADRVGYK